MTKRHKVFISFHHANDEDYKQKFESLFHEHAEILISGSVQDDDINPNSPTETIRHKIRDNYLRDTTVTVVLVGKETWKRKHVDWEIGSSIRDTKYNPRSGLIGILLPTYPRSSPTSYDPYTIPPRLYDNIDCGFATLHDWSDNPDDVQEWIHAAFLRRNKEIPDNSYQTFRNNRTAERWYP